MAIADANCPRCGRRMVLVPSPDGKAPALMQCPNCDLSDPLKSEIVEGWIKGSLRPPA